MASSNRSLYRPYPNSMILSLRFLTS